MRTDTPVHFERLSQDPIVGPGMNARMDGPHGPNINGPSLVRVPAWLPNPLGRYYLYFAHHKGTYIRLAHADRVTGPYRIHEPGTLQLAESHFRDHIASPDVHVDDTRRELRMYFHGVMPDGRTQQSRVAFSRDGLTWAVREEIVPAWYLRAFRFQGHWYGVYMPGRFCRSHDGVANWEQGPWLPDGRPRTHSPGIRVRHLAVHVTGGTLRVYYTRVGDVPERIVMTRSALDPDWTRWRFSEPVDILAPVLPCEGANAPRVPSRGGPSWEPAFQLRDPAIFEEHGETYLLYAIAGEQGIGLARQAGHGTR